MLKFTCLQGQNESVILFLLEEKKEKKMKEQERLIRLAEECLLREGKERPELVWLKGIYERFRADCGLLGKSEADSLIFEKMYSRAPEKASDVLKIRYWRTGRHVPADRTQLLSFGKALNMDCRELDYFVKAYYDKSRWVFGPGMEKSREYLTCRRFMDGMIEEYLSKIHPGRMLQLKISRIRLENNVRHLYYTDALKYIHVDSQRIQKSLDCHITSINYGSELSRTLRLEGEIPRKTMIRHLFICKAPFINRVYMDTWLEEMGYLPLTEEHTLTGGESLDWLLIRLLELYEECCTGKEPEHCMRWLQNACRILDEFFEERGKNSLRFMYFKALKE